MSNLHDFPFDTKKKHSKLGLKIAIVVIVLCGVANTYVMGLLWYTRGFHWSYVITGAIMLFLVAFALWFYPSKYKGDWEPEYIEPDIYVDGEGRIA